nr:probable low affinity copper uptake protein 2 isoform X3 [Equus asinus]
MSTGWTFRFLTQPVLSFARFITSSNKHVYGNCQVKCKAVRGQTECRWEVARPHFLLWPRGAVGLGTWGQAATPGSGRAPGHPELGAAWELQLPGTRAPASPEPRDRAGRGRDPAAVEPTRSQETRARSCGPGARHGGMAFSVLVVLLLAVLYESIKVGKAKLLHQALVSLSIPTSQQLIEEMDQDSSGSDSPPVSKTRLRSLTCQPKQVWERLPKN